MLRLTWKIFVMLFYFQHLLYHNLRCSIFKTYVKFSIYIRSQSSVCQVFEISRFKNIWYINVNSNDIYKYVKKIETYSFLVIKVSDLHCHFFSFKLSSFVVYIIQIFLSWTEIWWRKEDRQKKLIFDLWKKSRSFFYLFFFCRKNY